MALVIPVILCGGSGTRLWPLSRSGFPKQFLVLSGDGSSQSLFQQAVERINSVDNVGNTGNESNSKIRLGDTLVVTNEDHRFLVLDQLRELQSIKARACRKKYGARFKYGCTLCRAIIKW